MSDQTEGFVEFEVPLVFPYGPMPSGGGSRNSTTIMEPGTIAWDGSRIRQFYDSSPRTLPGVLKINGTCTPDDIPKTLFDIGVEEVDEMSWDEVTGKIRINTNGPKPRELRPFHFSERAEAVDGAVRLADACFPSTVRERGEADPAGIAAYLLSLVPLIALPLVFLIAVIAIGAPIWLIAIPAVLTALAGMLAYFGVRSRQRLREQQAEMIASGMGAVTIRPGIA